MNRRSSATSSTSLSTAMANASLMSAKLGLLQKHRNGEPKSTRHHEKERSSRSDRSISTSRAQTNVLHVEKARTNRLPRRSNSTPRTTTTYCLKAQKVSLTNNAEVKQEGEENFHGIQNQTGASLNDTSDARKEEGTKDEFTNQRSQPEGGNHESDWDKSKRELSKMNGDIDSYLANYADERRETQDEPRLEGAPETKTSKYKEAEDIPINLMELTREILNNQEAVGSIEAVGPRQKVSEFEQSFQTEDFMLDALEQEAMLLAKHLRESQRIVKRRSRRNRRSLRLDLFNRT